MDARQDCADARAAPGSTRLEFDIEWPPGHVAAYVIDGPEPILVDAGTAEDEGDDAMRAALGDAGYDVEDISSVVVTHPHGDHVGQVPLFREAGADVYAPEAVLDQLRRDEAVLYDRVRRGARSAGLEPDRVEEEAERACESLRRDRDLVDPESAIGFPFDEPFEVESRTFRAVHTPGHQVNHAALLTTIGDERVCFSGDVLIETFRAAAIDVGLDEGAADALDHFYTSMDRLEAHSIDRAYPGHGPVFTDVDGAIASTRENLDGLVDATLETLADVAPATAMDVVRERFGDVKYPAQLLDTLGALGRLESQGAVTVETRGEVRYYEPA